MNDSRTKNATRNALAGIFNRVVGLLIPFILRTALIKVLGEEYLGLSNLFASILQVLNLADLGFSSAIVYHMYKPIAEGDDEKVCALLKLYRIIYAIIGSVILVAGLCLTPFLDHFVKGDYPEGLNIYILYFMYLANTCCEFLFFAHRRSLMAAFQRSDIAENINSIVQLIFNVLKLVLLFALKNYYIYILFVPLTTILSGMITLITSYKLYPQYRCRGKLDKQTIKDILKRVFGLTLQKFGNTISTSLDSIIVSSFLGLSALAIYSNYFYIPSSLISFAWVAISATTAGLGNSIVTESKEKNYFTFKTLNFLNQWVITWCVPCLLCLYQHFMKIWVGEKLMSDNTLVILMVVYFYVTQSRKIVMVFKDAAGIWWADKYKPLVGCIVNLIFNIVSVQYIGMNGVILSTIVSYLFIEIPWENHVLFKKYFEMSNKEYYLTSIKHLVIIIISTVGCMFICNKLSDDGIIFFIVKGVICVLVSNIVFFAAFGRTQECKHMINIVKNKATSIIKK